MTQCLAKAVQRLIRLGTKKGGRGETSRQLGQAPKIVVKLPPTHIEAAKSLREEAFVRDDMKNPAVNPEIQTHPDIVRFWEKFSDELARRKMPFKPFEMYRSNDRQARLIKQRVTKAGPGKSPHNYGMAVDVVHAYKYWDLTRNQWDVVGAIGKEVARKAKIKIEWGGDWKFYDPAHWELAEWRARVRSPLGEFERYRKSVATMKEAEKSVTASRYFHWLDQLTPPF